MAALPQANLPAAAARYAGVPRLDPASAGSLLTNEPDGDIRKQVRWTLHPVLYMQGPFKYIQGSQQQRGAGKLIMRSVKSSAIL